MTVEDAISYIDSVLAQVPATREQHIRIQAALKAIAQAALPPAPETTQESR